LRPPAAPFSLPLLFSRPSSHPVVRLATVIAAVLASVAVAHAAPLVATQITAENYATHHVGGPDSDAGIGDWFLSNGTICATITAPEHESAITPRGGVLTDLGHCGAANDQWIVLQPMLNLSQSHVVPIDEVKAELGPKRASIHTRAVFEGVELITTYSVTREPRAMHFFRSAKSCCTPAARPPYSHSIASPPKTPWASSFPKLIAAPSRPCSPRSYRVT
jgi:hypothetical protein